MGLDMNLYQNIYYGGKWRAKGKHSEPHTLQLSGEFAKKHDIKNDDITEIVKEVAYWRKANAIHRWFIKDCSNDGIDNCKPLEVSWEHIEELHNLCVLVATHYENGELNKCAELLPPQSGFFFGDTDINEWYYEDVKYTIGVLAPYLNLDRDLMLYNNFTYHASW